MTFRFASRRYWALVASLLFLIVSAAPGAAASSTQGPNPPSATISANNLSNRTNAFGSNDAYATGTNGKMRGYSGFRFTVDAGSTIYGIVLSIEVNKGTCIDTNPQFSVWVSNDGGATLAGGRRE